MKWQAYKPQPVNRGRGRGYRHKSVFVWLIEGWYAKNTEMSVTPSPWQPLEYHSILQDILVYEKDMRNPVFDITKPPKQKQATGSKDQSLET
ncbi:MULTISPECIES: hypothetical protein [Sporomusa]|jgi:hypothetical protein|uniref:hypothetical protein n=2 Tax=Sporomusaceae TaxID=1843490 RepID=UPI0031583B0D